MCDTLFVPPESTAEHAAVFGKNSDRERNEAQTVEFFRGADHDADAQVKCTYVAIPQARRTNAVLLCRPFWCWGAEMGANEHGVVIGNEGLHARIPAPDDEALIGMDLVRLALERASTAAAAVDVIATLLRQYGQGGNCGHLMQAFYNNGFLVADATEAYVLETVGRDWLKERVTGVRTLSNTYSIGRNPESLSPGLISLVHDEGWSLEQKPNYGEVISNPNREHIGHARERMARSTALLTSRIGSIRAVDIMHVLRDHAASGPSARSDHRAKVTLCMHAGDDSRPGQTTGSLVSELRGHQSIHWVTGTAAPCTSIFKPVLIHTPLPVHGLRPDDRFDVRTVWWSHERLHRTAILGDLDAFLHEIHTERMSLEASFSTRMNEVVNGGGLADRTRAVAKCWEEAGAAEVRWLEIAQRLPQMPSDSAYSATWHKMNRLAGLDTSA